MTITEETVIETQTQSWIPAFLCSDMMNSFSLSVYRHFFSSSSLLASTLLVLFKFFCVIYNISLKVVMSNVMTIKRGKKQRYQTSVVSSLLLKLEHWRTWSSYLFLISSSCWLKHTKKKCQALQRQQAATC